MPLARIETLGLCEHCGVLLNIDMMPGEALDAPWHCPSCKKELSHLSFGYDEPSGARVRWMGPDGSWTINRPASDFRIGDLHILVKNPPIYY